MLDQPKADMQYRYACALARFIQNHGQDATVQPNGAIRATCEVLLPDGSLTTETTTLRPVIADVRAWLGY